MNENSHVLQALKCRPVPRTPVWIMRQAAAFAGGAMALAPTVSGQRNFSASAFAGGAMARGSDLAVRAIDEGQKAAMSMGRFLGLTQG